MATMFDAFLSEKKINPLRIIAASAKLERLRPEDRAIRLAQRVARKSEDGGKKREGLAAKKPRSGRAVTQRTVDAAIKGKELSGAAKTRLLRAINHLLEQKKQDKVTLAALFEKNPNPKPKKAPKAE